MEQNTAVNQEQSEQQKCLVNEDQNQQDNPNNEENKQQCINYENQSKNDNKIADLQQKEGLRNTEQENNQKENGEVENKENVNEQQNEEQLNKQNEQVQNEADKNQEQDQQANEDQKSDSKQQSLKQIENLKTEDDQQQDSQQYVSVQSIEISPRILKEKEEILKAINEQQQIENQENKEEETKIESQDENQQKEQAEEEENDYFSHQPNSFYEIRNPLTPEQAEELLEQIKQKKNIENAISIYHEQFKKKGLQKEFLRSSKEKGHYCLKYNFHRDQSNGKLIFQNNYVINNQKQVVSYLLKQISSNIWNGKSILNISLPVNLFEQRSMLERYAQSFSQAPYFFKKLNDQHPSVRLQKGAAFLLSTTVQFLDLEKPFNPILGETFQCRIQGYPFYAEQISHHPPTSAFYYVHKDFKLYGQFENVAHLCTNSIKGVNQGVIYVEFNDKKRIGLIQAPGSINGTSFGQRYVSIEGKYLGFDLDNQLILEMQVNPDKKSFWSFGGKDGPQDGIRGGIYKLKSKEFKKYFVKLEPEFWKFKGVEKDYVEEKMHEIEGRWTDKVLLDQKDVIFDINNPEPPKIQDEEGILPSDSKYREDLIMLRAGNDKQSQEMKEILENIQRNDRKLRTKKKK